MSQDEPLEKLVRNAQQRYGLEAQSLAALPGFSTEITETSRHMVGICLLGHAGFFEAM